ncbi:hypothetical protein MRX96_021808 [Rhipicephalus microplus]
MEQEHSAPEQPQNECTTRSSSADLRNTPCTRGDGEPVCQLLWHLEECNHLLFPIGYQLIDQEDDDAGELRLVPPPATERTAPVGKFHLVWRPRSQSHRTVSEPLRCAQVSVPSPILSAIQGGVGVKRVHVYDIHDITRYYPALNQRRPQPGQHHGTRRRAGVSQATPRLHLYRAPVIILTQRSCGNNPQEA